VIFAAGPTRIGVMIPASAASIGPRRELSSHGWATTVVAGGTCLARAISRSYLEAGGWARGPTAAIVAIVPISLAFSVNAVTSSLLCGVGTVPRGPTAADDGPQSSAVQALTTHAEAIHCPEE
jgi:hypothetical protein